MSVCWRRQRQPHQIDDTPRASVSFVKFSCGYVDYDTDTRPTVIEGGVCVPRSFVTEACGLLITCRLLYHLWNPASSGWWIRLIHAVLTASPVCCCWTLPLSAGSRGHGFLFSVYFSISEVCMASQQMLWTHLLPLQCRSCDFFTICSVWFVHSVSYLNLKPNDR